MLIYSASAEMEQFRKRVKQKQNFKRWFDGDNAANANGFAARSANNLPQNSKTSLESLIVAQSENVAEQDNAQPSMNRNYADKNIAKERVIEDDGQYVLRFPIPKSGDRINTQA